MAAHRSFSCQSAVHQRPQMTAKGGHHPLVKGRLEECVYLPSQSWHVVMNGYEDAPIVRASSEHQASACPGADKKTAYDVHRRVQGSGFVGPFENEDGRLE